MPFSISQNGYGSQMQGGLGALIGNDYAKYQNPNPFGLQDYIPEGFGDVNIDGGKYNVRYDPTTQKYTLGNLADPHQGSYTYGKDGTLENWANTANDSYWPMAGQFLASALTMGLGGAAMGAASTAGDAGAGMATGGFLGEGAASGIGAWDGALSGAQAGAVGGGGLASSVGGPGSPGWGSDLGGAGAPDGAAQAYSGASGLPSMPGGPNPVSAASAPGMTGNPLIDKIITGGATSGVGSTISSALGGSGAAGGSGGSAAGGAGNGLGGIISGAYDAYAQNKSASNMLDYMKTQQGKIDSIYNDPNSNVAKTMWGQMSAADAASGRNSQYGTRTTDFLGKYGGDYAKYTAALTQGLAGNYQQAYNQQASAGTGLATGIGNAINSGATSALNGILTQNGSSAISSNQGGNAGAYSSGGSSYNNPSAYGGSIPYQTDTNEYNPNYF